MKMSGKLFAFIALTVAVGIIVGTWVNHKAQTEVAKAKAAKAVAATA